MIFLCFGLLRAAEQPIKINNTSQIYNIYFSNTEDNQTLEIEPGKDSKKYAYTVIYNLSDFEIQKGTLKTMSINIKTMQIKAKKSNINLTLTYHNPSSSCISFDYHFGPLKSEKTISANSGGCLFLFGYPKISVEQVGFEKIIETDTFVQLKSLSNPKITKITVDGYTYDNYPYTKGFYYYTVEKHAISDSTALEITSISDSNLPVGTLVAIIVIPIIILVALIVGVWFLLQHMRSKNNPDEQNHAQPEEPVASLGKHDSSDSYS